MRTSDDRLARNKISHALVDKQFLSTTGWNMFKVNNKNDVTDFVLVFFLSTWTYFTPVSRVSIVDLNSVLPPLSAG